MGASPGIGLSRYIYGTTRLGDEKIAFAERVRIAREAMDASVWFHTSHTYGDALKVLRAAFDEDRKRVPKLVFKIGWSTIEELREVIRLNIDPLGIGHMDVGQLCLGGQLAEEFRTGGPCFEGFQRLKEEGLVKRFVVEVFPWTSQAPLDALKARFGEGLVDAHIFYLNPLQRFVSNPLWDLLTERNAPIIAMRTVGGGDVHALRDVPGAAWKDYLKERAGEIAPLFERSDVNSWVEFCARFALGFPNVLATVGSTSRSDRLQAFLGAAKDPLPLPEEIHQEILTLQRRWSASVDAHAEPWSM